MTKESRANGSQCVKKSAPGVVVFVWMVMTCLSRIDWSKSAGSHRGYFLCVWSGWGDHSHEVFDD